MPDEPLDAPQIRALKDTARQVRDRIGQVVYGAEDAIDLMLVALGAQGHILLEGLPGVGKTTLAKTFSHVTGLDFGRVQLTPDMMPADITGHTYYDQKQATFEIRKGPVFTNLLLADELNRTPPRTQAALLEVMQERQVTIEGHTLPAPDPFLVIATKNPIEIEGVYTLPEAELDRFMVHLNITYPERDTEALMLESKLNGHGAMPEPLPAFPKALFHAVPHVRVHTDVRHYLMDIARATREHPELQYGASPRAAEHLQSACRAHAALRGRWYVVPDDVKRLVTPVLAHRLLLTAEAEVDETDPGTILGQIVNDTDVPIDDQSIEATTPEP